MNLGSLETLLREHDWMRRLARQLVADSAAADDLVQQAWSDLLRSHARIDPERGVRGFLATILRRGATKRKLEDARRARRESIVPPGEPLPSPESIVSEVETQRAVVDAVLELDEPYRETVILRWWKDKSVAEIARERSLTHDAVETRLKRAHAKLREALARRHGGDPRRAAFSLMPLAIAAKPNALIPAASAIASSGVLATLGAIAMSKILIATGITVVGASIVAYFLRGQNDVAPTAKPIEAAVASRVAGPESDGEAPTAAPIERVDVASTNARPSGAASDATCIVRVRDAEGDVVRDARVLLDAPQGFVRSELTDANGETTVECHTACDAYVFAPGCAPTRRHVDLRGKVAEVRLDRGVSIEGTVLIDGRPPGDRTVFVAYHPDRPFAALESAPAAVFAHAKAFDLTSGLEAIVEPSGRFCFRGLASGETGSLAVRSPYLRFGSAEETAWKRVTVRAPAVGITIRTLGQAIVRGRVLDFDAKPVASAVIEIASRKRNSASTGSSSGATGPDGTFEIPHWLDDCEWFTLTADSRSGDRVSRRFPGPLAAECAVGDLVLERAEPLRFRAVDVHGGAIAGAIAFVVPAPRRRSEPTGADGRGVLRVAPSLRTELIVVYAPSFDGAALDASDGAAGAADSERLVTLTRATKLEVTLGPATVDWPPRRTLVLTSDDPRAIERRAIDRAVLRADEAGYDPWNADDEVRIHVSLGESNHGTIERLTSGVRWSLAVAEMSSSTTPTLTPASIVLEPGESRVLELAAADPLHTLAGTVRDTSGAPQGGAMVWPIAKCESGQYIQSRSGARTDGVGRFRIVGLTGSMWDLEVQRDGFARKHVSDVDVTNNPDSLEIVLEPGRLLRCRVVDADEKPLRKATVEMQVADRDPEIYSWTPRAVEESPGEYVFRDVQFAGAQRGRIDLSGLRYDFAIAADESETTVRVPVMGSLVVHRDFAIDGFPHRMWLVDEATGREQAIPEILVDPGQTTSDETIEHVLPGRYRVVVKRKGNDDDAFREIARAENVVVEAGLRATATLSQTRSPR